MYKDLARIRGEFWRIADGKFVCSDAADLTTFGTQHVLDLDHALAVLSVSLYQWFCYCSTKRGDELPASRRRASRSWQRNPSKLGYWKYCNKAPLLLSSNLFSFVVTHDPSMVQAWLIKAHMHWSPFFVEGRNSPRSTADESMDTKWTSRRCQAACKAPKARFYWTAGITLYTTI